MSEKSGTTATKAPASQLSGGTNQPVSKAAATGSGGSANSLRRKASGSTQTLSHGRMSVKIYPINEDQLAMIGLLRGVSTLCFAFAGTCFGFGINVIKDLEISSGAAETMVARWQTVSYISIGLAVLLGIAGALFWWKGHSTISGIHERTDFQ